MSTKKPTSNKTVATEEDYEFAPIENTGKVNIKTLSYDRGSAVDHIHTVTVTDDTAVSCSCKGHKYDVTTKHREAVENNDDVLALADPGRCSNGDKYCPGPAAIDVANGPEVGDKFACFECWMAAFRASDTEPTEREDLEGER